MAHKLSQELVNSRFAQNGGVVISAYFNEKTKVEVIWGCGHREWKSPKSHKLGCGICFSERNITSQTVQKIGDQMGFQTVGKVSSGVWSIKWGECGHTEDKKWDAIRQKKGCRQCSAGHHKSLQELQSIAQSRGLVFKDQYLGVKSPTPISWNECGHTENKTVDKLIRGQSCGVCARSNQTSNAETAIYQHVKSLCCDAVQSDRTQIAPKELDIWIPSKKVAIEYCGLRWHSTPILIDRRYHLNKLETCLEKGIRLITIFENEWLGRPQVIKSYLTSILGVPPNKLMARKLRIEPISYPDIKTYLNEHHVQGAPANAQASYVLRNNDEIVAGITFTRTHSRTSPDANRRPLMWELTRYCVKSDVQVVGGFQKLFKAFIREFDPAEVLSFSDRRWSVGGIYERNGFRLDRYYGPSYWYWKDHQYKLHHKSSFQKRKIIQKLGPILEGETEHQAMARMGWNMIWDCGLARWIWTPDTKSV